MCESCASGEDGVGRPSAGPRGERAGKGVIQVPMVRRGLPREHPVPFSDSRTATHSTSRSSTITGVKHRSGTSWRVELPGDGRDHRRDREAVVGGHGWKRSGAERLAREAAVVGTLELLTRGTCRQPEGPTEHRSGGEPDYEPPLGLEGRAERRQTTADLGKTGSVFFRCGRSRSFMVPCPGKSCTNLHKTGRRWPVRRPGVCEVTVERLAVVAPPGHPAVIQAVCPLARSCVWVHHGRTRRRTERARRRVR